VLLEFRNRPSVAAPLPHLKPALPAWGIAEHGIKGTMAEITEQAKEKLGRTDG
jgi:hypothetical protein